MFSKLRSLTTRFSSAIRLYFTGFAMGGADLVPGVSGGTIAFIFGIYEELLATIKNLSGNTLRLILKGKFLEAFRSVPWSFLIPLGLGLMSALAALATTLTWLLETYPSFLWAFFFGLVLASIFLVRKKVVTWDKQDYAALVAGTLLAFWVVGAVPVSTPDNLLAFFLSGAVAICAMILPGISGSFILVVLGKYEQVLGTLVRVISTSVDVLLLRWSEIAWTQYRGDLLQISVFAVGCVVGLALFSRVLTWLFAKHHDIAVATLIGVMIGSLRKIWPWKEVLSTRVDRHGDIVPLLERNVFPAMDGGLIISLVLVAAGIALILLLEKYSVTDEHVEDIHDPKFVAERKAALISQEHTLVKKVKRFFSRS